MRHEHKVGDGRYTRTERSTRELWYLLTTSDGRAAEAHLDPANDTATVHEYRSDGPLMAHEGFRSTKAPELLETDDDAIWARLAEALE